MVNIPQVVGDILESSIKGGFFLRRQYLSKHLDEVRKPCEGNVDCNCAQN